MAPVDRCTLDAGNSCWFHLDQQRKNVVFLIFGQIEALSGIFSCVYLLTPAPDTSKQWEEGTESNSLQQTTTFKCNCFTSLLIAISRGRVWLHAEVISWKGIVQQKSIFFCSEEPIRKIIYDLKYNKNGIKRLEEISRETWREEPQKSFSKIHFKILKTDQLPLHKASW